MALRIFKRLHTMALWNPPQNISSNIRAFLRKQVLKLLPINRINYYWCSVLFFRIILWLIHLLFVSYILWFSFLQCDVSCYSHFCLVIIRLKIYWFNRGCWKTKSRKNGPSKYLDNRSICEWCSPLDGRLLEIIGIWDYQIYDLGLFSNLGLITSIYTCCISI